MHHPFIQLGSLWTGDMAALVKVNVTSALHLTSLVEVVLGG